MKKHEQIIKAYFECWLNPNPKVLAETFAPEAVYSECYGPEYRGLSVIENWFTDWNEHGSVQVWDIKQFIHQDQRCAVEWYFKCEYEHEICEFDGVSLVEFDDQDRIVSVKEFQSKIPYEYAYK
jgi:hypothetical protein